jgi:hypothetical protein
LHEGEVDVLLGGNKGLKKRENSFPPFHGEKKEFPSAHRENPLFKLASLTRKEKTSFKPRFNSYHSHPFPIFMHSQLDQRSPPFLAGRSGEPIRYPTTLDDFIRCEFLSG